MNFLPLGKYDTILYMGQNNTKQHIGIIGGGASGIACALRLCELGHTVTVLEASAYIGGKCTSAIVEGRHVDVGGGAGIPGRYDIVKKISDAVGITTRFVPHNRDVSVVHGETPTLPKGAWKKAVAVWQICKYIFLYYRYGCSQRSGLYRYHSDLLSTSWETFSKKHSLTLVEEVSRKSIFGFGYGEAKDIHMGYVFNYITPKSLLLSVISFWKKSFLYYWEEGTQEIWRRVSEKLVHEYGARVRVNSAVTNVVRSEKDVHVTCSDGTSYVFDTIVISTDKEATVQFLDGTPTERMVCGKILYNDYRTYVCKVEHFDGHDQKGITYIWEYIRDYTMNKPVFWSKRYEDLHWYVFYVPVRDATNEQIIDEIQTFVRNLGGEVTQVQDIFSWRMFPHVHPNDATEFIHDMQDLQGQRHTYYIGEVYSFSLLPCVVEYAFDVAERIDAESRGK